MANTNSKLSFAISYGLAGGCWLIPPGAKPRLVIYVGPPLAQDNPGKTWAAYHATRFKQSNVLKSLRGRAIGCYYIFRQPLRNFSMIRMARTAQPVIFDQAVTVFIGNRQDPWLQDAKLQTYIDNRPWAFIGLPGTHDHIWEQSADYVSIINHYAKLLA